MQLRRVPHIGPIEEVLAVADLKAVPPPFCVLGFFVKSAVITFAEHGGGAKADGQHLLHSAGSVAARTRPSAMALVWP